MKTPKKYVRDNRSPTPKSESTSRVMSANKSKNTKPEIILRKTLWAAGIRGYRCNYKKAPGRLDIAFPKRKLAIFVNGCFWHRCPYCNLPLPKNNRAFWKKKFEANKKRDIVKIKTLQREGWEVIVIWECKISQSLTSLFNVRPKGTDSRDLMETASGKMEKKKAYWLNSSYIKHIIETA